jgi:hypothetical protein
VRDGGIDEEDGYMGLRQYFRNENGSRSTYRRELISENVMCEEQVIVSKSPEGRRGALVEA